MNEDVAIEECDIAGWNGLCEHCHGAGHIEVCDGLDTCPVCEGSRVKPGYELPESLVNLYDLPVWDEEDVA